MEPVTVWRCGKLLWVVRCPRFRSDLFGAFVCVWDFMTGKMSFLPESTFFFCFERMLAQIDQKFHPNINPKCENDMHKLLRNFLFLVLSQLSTRIRFVIRQTHNILRDGNKPVWRNPRKFLERFQIFTTAIKARKRKTLVIQSVWLIGLRKAQNKTVAIFCGFCRFTRLRSLITRAG